MSKRPVAYIVAGFVACGALTGLAAGYSAYVIRPSYAAAGATEHAGKADRMAGAYAQASNASNKTDRLPVIHVALETPASTAGPMLASAQQGTDLGRFTDIVAAASAMADKAPHVDQAPQPAAVVHAPLPPQKPKRPAPESGDLLGDGQIAGLKSRLRLTDDQIGYWPAVEAALREVARTQLHAASAKRARGGKAAIDVNSPEVQKLIYAAMPLLMRLREDQKREVRKLARVIGLEQVASQI